MSVDTSWMIGPTPGFTPAVGHLVAMLRFTRRMTLLTVAGLRVEELDHLSDHDGNSIGALLMHVAAVEAATAVESFERRELSPSELAEWGVALELGERARGAIRGRDLAHYVAILERVRSDVLAGLALRDDAWLYEEAFEWDGLPGNRYAMWFHSIENEIGHRGQIRLLCRQLRRSGPTRPLDTVAHERDDAAC